MEIDLQEGKGADASPGDAVVSPECPFCGGDTFEEIPRHGIGRCIQCNAKIRHRAAYVLLKEFCQIDKNSKIAHFAPEPQISSKLNEMCGENYTAYDFNNTRYKLGFEVRHCDLCKDIKSLPQAHYDVVMHNHVLEHVPCNYTIVLQQLHGLLKPGGVHIFSFPVYPGSYYREDQNPGVSREARTRLYNQKDHLRLFGGRDFEQMVGRIFDLTNDYSLAQLVAPEKLLAAGIPPKRWVASGSTVFAVRKL